MKKISILIILIFLLESVFSQNTIEWKEIPVNTKGDGEIKHQTNDGQLIALLPAAQKFVIRKDNGSTWQPLILPKYIDFTGFRQTHGFTDCNGEIYAFGYNEIFILDKNTNVFSLFFKSKKINDVEITNDKMYIATESGLDIYSFPDKKLLTHLKCKSYATKLYIGENRKCYAYTKPENSKYELFVFDKVDFSYKKTSVPEHYTPSPEFLYLSPTGRLFTFSGWGIFCSDSQGETWELLPAFGYNLDPKQEFKAFTINQYGEIYLAVDEKILYSTDDGKSWIETKYKVNAKDYFSYFNFFSNKVKNEIACTFFSQIGKGKLILGGKNGNKWRKKSLDLDNPLAKRFTLSHQGDIFEGVSFSYSEVLEKNSKEWKEINPKSNMVIHQILVCKSGKWIAYDKITNSYFTSKNKGKSWQKYQKLPIVYYDYSFMFQDQYLNLIVIDHEKIFISRDEGETWNEWSTRRGWPPNSDSQDKIMSIEENLYWTSQNEFIVHSSPKIKDKVEFNLPKGVKDNYSITTIGFHQLGIDSIISIVRFAKREDLVKEHLKIIITDLEGNIKENKLLPKENNHAVAFFLNKSRISVLVNSIGDISIATPDYKSFKSLNTNIREMFSINSIKIDNDGFLYAQGHSNKIYKTTISINDLKF